MELVVVSLTSWKERIGNIPTVIDCIKKQTVQPDVIVLNLSREEFPDDTYIPAEVRQMADRDDIRINWVKKNTGVWKKFIPTLDLYPNDVVIAIDDDFIYPSCMIEDFLNVHRKYPESPISGNKYWRAGIKCHCGCASLIKKEYFGDFLKYADEDTMSHCTSSDMFYTRMAAANGRFYVETKGTYFSNLPRIEDKSPEYSKTVNKGGVARSGRYCYNRLGYEVIKHASPDCTMPLCVLGTMHNDRGLVIAQDMLRWLCDYYEVHEVVHNGLRFEYPATDYASRLSRQTGRPVLYIHTKGAHYIRKRTPKVRRMWADEFTRNLHSYFKAVDCSTPAVATPFTGKDKETWLNAFVANAEAFDAIGDIKITDDRFYYERLFCGSDVDVKGIIMDDIIEPAESRAKMHQYIDTRYAR